MFEKEFVYFPNHNFISQKITKVCIFEIYNIKIMFWKENSVEFGVEVIEIATLFKIYGF